ncbi:branched-chain amino acid ABC transporter permease [Paraburkholderia dipogonis]|uniref:Branched-chain amino acid ABC transporter permease n=1 Tax=Paraburkholderia dipogonis TaxID=1211383 RepID=A0A4Y8MGH3_9BURK|nr:branched-chain amino acid ABC transporter permease [Paraburkholderia dipogonis]TFE36505.1 branched-chain amino acid ABC transporter permease [Paraburkholderia dipogonis]
MIDILNQALQALMLGGLYAMFALGLSVSVGVLRFVNVAHGDMIVLLSFLFMSLVQSLGVPVLVAALLTVPAGMGFGWVLQRGVLQRAANLGELQVILVTFGLSIVIQNVLLAGFGADPRKVSLGGLEAQSIPLAAGVNVGIVPLLIVVAAIVLIYLLDRILHHTAIGVAIRAVADSNAAARLNGLPVNKLFAAAMAIVGITVAVAGDFMAVWTNFDPSSGPSRLLIAFEVVVLAGLGSYWGVLLAGILIAMAQTIGASIDSAYQVVGGHVMFLILFLIRPNGLFPKI